MKHFTLSILLVVAYIGLNAQHWRPISLAETHHFRSDTAQHFPDMSIRVDSITGSVLDSVFHLTRYLDLIAPDAAILNRPGFCQYRMHALPDGWYQFEGPGNIAIHATANLNDVWLLDSVQSITATVEDLWQGTVMGQADSLKLLRLTGGDSLILSKDHGIVEWPATLGAGHFQLVGLQQQALGETYPTFEEWFPYQVGQQFFWDSYYQVWDGVGNHYYGHHKVEVTSVVYDTAGVHVSFSGLRQLGYSSNGSPVSWSPVFTYSSYEFSIYKTPGSAFARLNREPWRQPDSIFVYYAADLMQFRFADLCSQYLGQYSYSIYYNTTLRSELSRADTSLILNVGQFTPVQAGCFPPGPGDTVTSSVLYDQCAYRIRSGLGLEHVSHQGIDDNGFAELVGYITLSGDSVGNVWRTWFLTDVENAAPLSVQLMPNPAATQASIEWPSAEAWTLELCDAKGIQIRKEEGAGKTHHLDIADLPSGIYLLRLSQAGKSVNRKLVVSH